MLFKMFYSNWNLEKKKQCTAIALRFKRTVLRNRLLFEITSIQR